jgi:cytochrome P450
MASWHATLSKDVVQEKQTPRFPNLVQTMVSSGLPPSTALSEATENLGPGTDTTSASLAHILWALAHNPQFQEQLFEDLSAVSFSTDMTTLEGVLRLRACVKEGIRWTGAAAAMLPRIVPEGGITFHGHFIPGGVRIINRLTKEEIKTT